MLNLYNLQNKNGDDSNLDDQKENGVLKFTKKIDKKANFEQYIDPEGDLSSKGLKWGIWFTIHKAQFYKAVVILLFIFIIFIWGFNIYKWGFYLWNLPEYEKTEQQLTNSSNYDNLNYKYTAKPLQILGVQVFNSGVEKFDVISDVSNPNKDFIAYFDYSFYLSDTQISKKQKSFLLPEQNRPVVYMGVESKSGLSTPSINIENLRWERISAHEIQDVKKWQSYRLDFEMTNFYFSPSYSGEMDKPNANIITFNLTNNSPFDYTEPEFIISLYNGGSFVGVIPFKLSGIFRSLESRKVDLRNFVSNLSVSSAVINPLIDIYDDNVYSIPSKK